MRQAVRDFDVLREVVDGDLNLFEGVLLVHVRFVFSDHLSVTGCDCGVLDDTDGHRCVDSADISKDRMLLVHVRVDAINQCFRNDCSCVLSSMRECALLSV